MKDNNRDRSGHRGSGGKRFEGRSSGERGFGGRGGSRGFGDRDHRKGGFGARDSARPTTMHQAICSNCGKACEVPFRPTGDKPVYCSDCFGKIGPGNSPRFSEKRFDQPRFSDKKMFSAVCSNCGNTCEVPFRPTGDKPVYCHNCFGKTDHAPSKSTAGYQEQFKILNSKLDQILRSLSPSQPTEAKAQAITIRKAEPAKLKKTAKKISKKRQKK